MNTCTVTTKDNAYNLLTLTLILMLVIQLAARLLENGLLNTVNLQQSFIPKLPYLLGEVVGHLIAVFAMALIVLAVRTKNFKCYSNPERYRIFYNAAWFFFILNSFHSLLSVFITLMGFIIFIIVRAILEKRGWLKTIFTVILAIVVGCIGILYQIGAEQQKEKAVTMETITGANKDYSIGIPNNWKIERNINDYDILAHNKSLYIGVIAEEQDLENAKNVADLAKQRLKENTIDLTMSENQSFELDGRHWLQFTAKARVDNMPVSYLFYVYSGYEGTFQLVGFTNQNLFDRDVSKIHKILQTFHFSKPAKPSNKPDLPVHLSPKEALEKFDLGRDYYHNEQYAEAYRAWIIAADSNVLEAYNNLGYLAYNGMGVTENHVEGIRRWKIAAENGDIESQIHLAEAYAEGSEALQKDLTMAYVWATVAKHFAPRFKADDVNQTYSQDAENIIKDAKSKLNQEELKRANYKAASWIVEISNTSKSTQYIRRWPLKP